MMSATDNCQSAYRNDQFIVECLRSLENGSSRASERSGGSLRCDSGSCSWKRKIDYATYSGSWAQLPVDAPLMLEHLQTPEEYTEGRLHPSAGEDWHHVRADESSVRRPAGHHRDLPFADDGWCAARRTRRSRSNDPIRAARPLDGRQTPRTGHREQVVNVDRPARDTTRRRHAPGLIDARALNWYFGPGGMAVAACAQPRRRRFDNARAIDGGLHHRSVPWGDWRCLCARPSLPASSTACIPDTSQPRAAVARLGTWSGREPPCDGRPIGSSPGEHPRRRQDERHAGAGRCRSGGEALVAARLRSRT